MELVVIVVVVGDEYDIIIEPSALKIPALHLGKSQKKKQSRASSQPTSGDPNDATHNTQHAARNNTRVGSRESDSCLERSQSLKFAKKRPRSVAGDRSNNQHLSSTSGRIRRYVFLKLRRSGGVGSGV